MIFRFLLLLLPFINCLTLNKRAQCPYFGPQSSGPGGLFSTFQADGKSIPLMTPTNYVSAALRLNPNDDLLTQLQKVTALSSYDDLTLLNKSPECTVMAPNPRYEQNPTQILIGLTKVGTSLQISNTPVNIRLLDKSFAISLVYVMDQYGFNPHALLGLSTKESFATASVPNVDDSHLFLALGDRYDLQGKHFGYGTDGNFDGPFQLEKFTMATSMSIFPTRFQLGPTPQYKLDTEWGSSPILNSLHQTLTQNMNTATMISALDLYWRVNALLFLPELGFRSVFDQSQQRRDSLLFAGLFYAYNRGMYGDLGQKLCACTQGDPVTVCGLDGFGNHESDIRKVCEILEQADSVYEFPITMTEISQWLNDLQVTYPYVDQTVWQQLKSDVQLAFTYLSNRRQAKGGVQLPTGFTLPSVNEPAISFRLDLRLLMAVVRMHLPPRESLVGQSWMDFVQYSFGNRTASDIGTYYNPANVPLPNLEGPAGTLSTGAGSPVSNVLSSTTSSTRTSISSLSSSTSTSSISPTRTPASSTISATPTSTPTTLPQCSCPATSHFQETRGGGYGIGQCPKGQLGVLVQACLLSTTGECHWSGQVLSFCFGNVPATSSTSSGTSSSTIVSTSSSITTPTSTTSIVTSMVSTTTNSPTATTTSSTPTSTTATTSPTGTDFVQACFCPAMSGFDQTREGTYATKPCSGTMQGVIVNACLQNADGLCFWGIERPMCV